MISYFKTFARNENSMAIAAKLLQELTVKFTATGLESELYNHPDYPSLLSISDILTGYGVENITVRGAIDNLAQFPLPCIAPIWVADSHKELFTVIRQVTDNTVVYYHPEKRQWEHIDYEAFGKIWPKGIVMLADAENAVGEENYAAKLREEKRLRAAKYTAWLTIPLITVVGCTLTFATRGFAAGLPVLFTLLTLCGCVVGALLLWYELDAHNPMLQQICGAGKKVNCGAVLNSKAAKIVGISWSTLGFTYFAGGLFTLLFLGIANPGVWLFLAWANALAVPYIFFSVYYQWRIAKQWCLLCLTVQGILFLQLVIAITADWHKVAPVNMLLHSVIALTMAYALPFVVVSLIMPLYRLAKENKTNKAGLQRLKHNPEIFNALLEKQKAVTENIDGLGIVLGNPNAAQKIIKVCNPYCSPCATAHTPMEELLHNNPDVQLQIIFTCTNAETDISAKPVKHLLAVAAKGQEQLTLQALDDWYLAPKKDYEAFAAKYPMNGELKQQDGKIEAMMGWCNKTQVAFTPTFFVNGHQLPEVYRVNDLKYFLSV